MNVIMSKECILLLETSMRSRLLLRGHIRNRSLSARGTIIVPTIALHVTNKDALPLAACLSQKYKLRS